MSPHPHTLAPTGPASADASTCRGTCPHIARAAAKDAFLWANVDVLPSLSAAVKCGSSWTLPSSAKVIDGFRAIQAPPSCSYPGCGWDVDVGAVYCIQCNDYVYDEQFAPRQTQELDDHEAELVSIFASPTSPCGGLRGLKNLGATCYMNCILQALIHNPNLLLLGRFGPTRPARHAALALDRKRDIASAGQHDAHELFIALINAIHTGLTHGTPGSPPPTHRGTMLANGNLAASIPQQCPCAIHSTFGGVLHSKLTCTGCQNVTFLSESFLDLSLDLKATEQQAASNTWAPRASAMANADGHVSVQSVWGSQHRKQLTVQVAPKSICFQFKRFETSTNGSNKVEIPVTIPLTISMAQYMTRGDASQKKPNPLQYSYVLYAVVHHTGKLDTGHYTACILDRGHWFRMDDDKVTQVTEEIATGATAYAGW
ncbi:hypothetical protein BCR44DRAFT_1500383 [Catenaria anguillulae PL171]|uniref:Ubiquitin carboxyl-terminal hydrolase n=1 Tax=Catenaria anguillulae PL171 TaxID=765915 RepID=A0A1Y2HJ73_9FUNG|nr:hypothetical protein BCR44DRAFT_1500383 [Catenaria anguillulae PL171]